MKKIYNVFVMALLAYTSTIIATQPIVDPLEIVIEEDSDATDDQENGMNTADTNSSYVHKKILKNGLTVLVRPVHSLPKVTIQLWYNVGSKDEKTAEKGFAHLIEHMIFKGTVVDGKKVLSESDINIITHMLSGSTNAFTSYDFTGYLFNLPVQNWELVLPILADCMQNVGFQEDHLNSEMKAVIQELKMYRDNYQRSLIMEMMASIFPDHPYHYPVIGFKQDLFDVHADALRRFYKKHYWPNNATLVIVGDVEVDKAFGLAEHFFGSILANREYKKDTFFYNKDIASHSVTLYKDIKQPKVTLAYVIPGSQSKTDHLMEVLALIIGVGKGSRLYRKLVDDLKLVNALSAYPFQLFEHGLFFISFEPKNITDTEKIIALIQDELDTLAKEGIGDGEYTRALKQARMNYYSLLESIESQAMEIGRAYLSTGDENYAFHFLDKPKNEVEQELQKMVKDYFKSSVRHTGFLLPLASKDKAEWAQLQHESDLYDKKFLAARERHTPVEPPLYALNVSPNEAPSFDFPKYTALTLANGMKVLYYNNENTPQLYLAIDFKARSYFDDPKLPGLYMFVMELLTEGSKKYTAAQLADELESRGMRLHTEPGSIGLNFLSADLPKAIELLEEIIFHPVFDDKEIEKVREQLISQARSYWDEPNRFAKQLIFEQIYQGHPFSKNIFGTEESLKAITKKDIIEFHKKYISAYQARVALVGDLSSWDVKKALEPMAHWKGAVVEPIEFPHIKPTTAIETIYPINRDQVVLCFAGLSVDRMSPDYDKLLLFDQIFGGGALGSLHSRLYQLREQSGLFYNIVGSLVVNSCEQPGIVMIKTIVSLDKVEEAQKAIQKVIETAVDTITNEEFIEAKNAIVSSIVNNFANNQSIAQVFLALDKYGFPADYYDTRAQRLSKITVAQMKAAVKKVLKSNSLAVLKIGRLEKPAKRP